MHSTFRSISLFALLSIWGLVLPPQAQAQPNSGSVGIGLQLGQPSGLSLGVYKPSGMALDVLAAWNLNDFLYLNAHGLFSTGDASPFRLFYGPGVYVGLYERGNAEDQIAAGLSATGGVSIFIGSFEIYGRVTPRLLLISQTDVAIGGGLGLRLYL
jgi:hypothetical protein